MKRRNQTSLLKVALIGTAAILMAGCSSVSRSVSQYQMSQNPIYLKSQLAGRLKIPAGLSSDKIHEKYPLPPVSSNASVKAVSLIPPGSLSTDILKKGDKVSFRKAKLHLQNNQYGALRLYVPGKVGHVFPAMKSALASAGYTLSKKQSDIHSYFIMAKSLQSKQEKESVYQVHARQVDGFTSISVLTLRNQIAPSTLNKAVLQAMAHYFEDHHAKG